MVTTISLNKNDMAPWRFYIMFDKQKSFTELSNFGINLGDRYYSKLSFILDLS